MAKDPGRVRTERGAALISAMLIVSIMAVVSVSLLETVRFASRLSINLEAREQAQLYAVGAEELAAGSVKAAWVPGQERQPALEAWIRRPFFFPINGGSLQGEARDGANCFNLNSLAMTVEGANRLSNPAMIAEFTRLLTLLGVPASEATAIATATADWIDSDAVAGFSGAEDDYYGALEIPYRTAGGPMADPSEIKRIRGMTTALYGQVRPFLCTRPTLDPSVLNINTLKDWQAPLLAAVLGEGVEAVDALRILEERPVSGFLEQSLIYELPLIVDLDLDALTKERLGLRSRFVDLGVQVSYQGVFLDMISSLQISDTGDITTVSRRYGSEE